MDSILTLITVGIAGCVGGTRANMTDPSPACKHHAVELRKRAGTLEDTYGERFSFLVRQMRLSADELDRIPVLEQTNRELTRRIRSLVKENNRLADELEGFGLIERAADGTRTVRATDSRDREDISLS